jgi:hypothetical protein
LPYDTLTAYFTPSYDPLLQNDRVPLISRGWVLQEQMISRRILHCAKDQLHWECCTLEAREVFPQGKGTLFESRFKIANLGQSNNDIASKFLVWSVIHNRYTTTNLTRDSDRIPAISGLARKTYELMHAKESHYLAGLERENVATEFNGRSQGAFLSRGRRSIVHQHGHGLRP